MQIRSIIWLNITNSSGLFQPIRFTLQSQVICLFSISSENEECSGRMRGRNSSSLKVCHSLLVMFRFKFRQRYWSQEGQCICSLPTPYDSMHEKYTDKIGSRSYVGKQHIDRQMSIWEKCTSNENIYFYTVLLPGRHIQMFSLFPLFPSVWSFSTNEYVSLLKLRLKASIRFI